MLDTLFGSRTRYKLLQLFLRHPESRFFVRELTRETGQRLNAIRRELDNLLKAGIVSEVEGSEEVDEAVPRQARGGKRKYYQADTSAPLFPELRNLMMKSQVVADRKLFEKILHLGHVKILYLYGSFVHDETAPIDVYIVGAVPRGKLASFMASLKTATGLPVRYTLMSVSEFKFRNEITDKFLLDLAARKKIIIVGDHAAV